MMLLVLQTRSVCSPMDAKGGVFGSGSRALAARHYKRSRHQIKRRSETEVTGRLAETRHILL